MKGPSSMLATALACGLLAGSTLSVGAQEEPDAPVEFTGHIECGPDIGPNQWQQSATNSDPRLEGTYYYSEAYAAEPASAATAGTLRIENEDGAWQGSMVYVYLSDGTGTTGSTVLVGEGAYEGLSAIWEERMLVQACAADVRGLLIAGDVPTAPAAYVSE
jgi:hypothetical protein